MIIVLFCKKILVDMSFPATRCAGSRFKLIFSVVSRRRRRCYLWSNHGYS